MQAPRLTSTPLPWVSKEVCFKNTRSAIKLFTQGWSGPFYFSGGELCNGSGTPQAAEWKAADEDEELLGELDLS